MKILMTAYVRDERSGEGVLSVCQFSAKLIWMPCDINDSPSQCVRPGWITRLEFHDDSGSTVQIIPVPIEPNWLERLFRKIGAI